MRIRKNYVPQQCSKSKLKLLVTGQGEAMLVKFISKVDWVYWPGANVNELFWLKLKKDFGQQHQRIKEQTLIMRAETR